MFKETKEVVLKNMITMIQQIKNIKNRNFKNKTKSNSGIKKTLTEMKNSLSVIYHRFEMMKESVNLKTGQ